MVIIVSILVGGMFGFMGASLFAVNAYNKGYEDGRESEQWKSTNT